MTLLNLAERAHRNSRSKGFYAPPEGLSVLEDALLEHAPAAADFQKGNALVERLRERSIPEMLALITSEVSEALEEDRLDPARLRGARSPRPYQYLYRQEDGTYRQSENPVLVLEDGTRLLGKPVGFGSELADVVIRVLDLAAYLGLDLDRLVDEKMTYNETRPAKHGKQY